MSETETETTTALEDARDAYRAAIEDHAKAKETAQDLHARTRAAREAVAFAEDAVIKAEQRLLSIARG